MVRSRERRCRAMRDWRRGGTGTMSAKKLAFVVTSCLVIRTATAQPSAEPVVAPPIAAPPVVAPPAVAPPAALTQSVLPGVLPTTPGATFDGRFDYTDLEVETVNLLGFNLHAQY